MKSQHQYTPAEEQLIRELFHTHSPDEIGARIGVTRRGIQAKCNKLGLRHRADSSELRRVLLLAAVSGFYNADIEDWPVKIVRCQTDKLRNKGLLFPAKHSTLAGQTAKYFDTAEKARAFEATYKAEKPSRRVEREKRKETKAYKAPNMRQIVISKPRIHAWWPADAKPRITAQTVYTYGASPGRVLRTNTHAE